MVKLSTARTFLTRRRRSAAVVVGCTIFAAKSSTSSTVMLDTKPLDRFMISSEYVTPSSSCSPSLTSLPRSASRAHSKVLSCPIRSAPDHENDAARLEVGGAPHTVPYSVENGEESIWWPLQGILRARGRGSR
jgi:hypothetical protein